MTLLPVSTFEDLSRSENDGPLLFAMLLGNQNNNNGKTGADNKNNEVPDSLAIQSATVYELAGLHDVSAGGKLEASCTESGNEKLVLKLRRPTEDILTPPGLSAEQLQFWHENGYLIIPSILAQEEISALIDEAEDAAEILLAGGPGVKEHDEIVNAAGDRAYVSPCGRTMASLNPAPLDKAELPALAKLNHLGCGVHVKLPSFRRTILSHRHASIAQSLGFVDPRVTQSLVVPKSARTGAAIVPHQDGRTSFTTPVSCVTFWYALQCTTLTNGCLAVAPGSHRTEPLQQRCVRTANGAAEFVKLEKPVYAVVDEGSPDLPRRNEDGTLRYEMLPVEAGTLILLHGNLMHTSAANESGEGRLAFNFGVVEGGLEWRQDNYLQPGAGAEEFERLCVPDGGI